MSKINNSKVAVIDDVRAKVAETPTVVATEYRGLTVAEISNLRKTLRAAGADYKVLKNTLVKRAISGTQSEPLTEFLTGPTAVAFVNGDISAVAKILRDFAKTTPTLVLKGGVLDGRALSVQDLRALADLPSRDILLAQIAGMLASPLRTMAGLMKAVPQNFAYGLSALLDAKGGPVAVAEPVVDEVAETPVGVEDAVEAASDDTATEVAEVEVEAEAELATAEAEPSAEVDETPAAEPAE
ncbi:MAG: 50S ribosomal protein L10 [Actinomycetota bacterium]|jgi:large subunit ribosomal protein L10